MAPPDGGRLLSAPPAQAFGDQRGAARVGRGLAPTQYLQRGSVVFVWAIFALSFDLLIGYTGMVPSPFVVIGAYSIATGVMKLGLSFPVAILLALVLSALIAAVVGSLSLRLKGHGFLMITMAFAEVAHVLALKLSHWTGGEDGLSVRVPLWLANRTNDYYIGLALLVAVFLLVRRITPWPFGRVLEAIRENENRAIALGYNVTAYRVAAMTIAGVMTLGGAGTLIGPMLGAATVRLLAYVLPGLADVSPVFQWWQFLLDVIYIATVMFLPYGIVGTYQGRVKAALGRIFLPARKAT